MNCCPNRGKKNNGGRHCSECGSNLITGGTNMGLFSKKTSTEEAAALEENRRRLDDFEN